MSAYRKRYSCETRIVLLVEDSLHHALLLAKLKAYGLNEEALGLLGSYFRDRKIEKSLATLLVTERRSLDVAHGDRHWVHFFEMFFLSLRARSSNSGNKQRPQKHLLRGPKRTFLKEIFLNIKLWLICLSKKPMG